MAYVLPGDWMEKWQKFNDYSSFFPREDQEKGNMELENDRIECLDSIDPSNILLDTPLITDPLDSEFYTNFALKAELEENKDYYLVNEKCWNYLYSKYGGVPIPRPLYKKSESSMALSVEVWLQKVKKFNLKFSQLLSLMCLFYQLQHNISPIH